MYQTIHEIRRACHLARMDAKREGRMFCYTDQTLPRPEPRWFYL